MTSSILPKKHLGQNFLRDANLCNKISRFGDVEGRNVVEIGGGPGGLTKSIASFDIKKLTVVEKDSRFREILQGIADEVFIEDALKFDFTQIVDKHTSIIGNLPYNVGNMIIIRLLKTVRPKCMSFLLQKEVVERICAHVGDRQYGRLSVFVQAIARPKKGFVVNKKMFFPVPKVESQMLKIEDINYDAELIAVLEEITNKFFSNSRKKIGRMLDGFNIQVPDSEIRNLRPENISPAQYLEFSRQVLKLRN